MRDAWLVRTKILNFTGNFLIKCLSKQLKTRKRNEKKKNFKSNIKKQFSKRIWQTLRKSRKQNLIIMRKISELLQKERDNWKEIASDTKMKLISVFSDLLRVQLIILYKWVELNTFEHLWHQFALISYSNRKLLNWRKFMINNSMILFLKLRTA